jgi:hypothetical protein
LLTRTRRAGGLVQIVPPSVEKFQSHDIATLEMREGPAKQVS